MKKIRLKKQAKIFLASFLITVSILLLLILTTTLYIEKTKTLPPILNGIIQKVTNSENVNVEEKLPMNILLLGGDEKEGGRSDTIMLIHLRKDFQPVVVSIPRDTRVMIDGVKGYSKINAAYAYGKAKLAVKTVEDVLNIKIDKYIAVNYEAVKKVVDLLNGVDVDVPFHLYYVDKTPGRELYIDIPAGKQHLDGENAVKFLRWRHNSNGKEYGQGGDLGRIEMQRRLINALIDRLLQPQNILKIPTMIQSISKYTDHNFTKSEMMWFAQNVGRFSKENIIMTTLPGYPRYIDKVSYFIMNEEKSKLLMDDLNEPDISKNNISVKILCNSIDDNVKSIKSDFEQKGYGKVELSRAYPKLKNNIIALKKINRKYLDIVKADINSEVYQIVYDVDYNDKFDVYLEIAN